MIEYEYHEYLYIPFKNPESSFLPLRGEDLESLFVIHERVIEELRKEEFMSLIRLRFESMTSPESQPKAIGICLGVEKNNMKLEEDRLTKWDFEKLLSKAFRQLTSENGNAFMAAESSITIFTRIFAVNESYAHLLENDCRYSKCLLKLEQVWATSGRKSRSQKPRATRPLPSQFYKRSNLTRAHEECDSSPPMQEHPRQKFGNQSTIQSESSVFQDLRLPQADDVEGLQLRANLSKVIRSLSSIEANKPNFGKLLTFAAELNSSYIEFINHCLRSKIEPIEREINLRLQSIEPSTLPQKQEFARTVNAELRSLGLAIRCPKTNRPSQLVADPGSHPATGRYQFKHKSMDGREKRAFSTASLSSVTLMPDIASIDVDLALILSKLSDRTKLASLTKK